MQRGHSQEDLPVLVHQPHIGMATPKVPSVMNVLSGLIPAAAF